MSQIANFLDTDVTLLSNLKRTLDQASIISVTDSS